MLENLARYAVTRAGDPAGAFPPRVAEILYVVAVASAAVRHGRYIGEVDWAAQRDTIERLAAEPWLDAPTRSLLRDATRLGGAWAGSPPRGSEPPSTAPFAVEGYQILGPLGRGGGGTVWRARQLDSRRDVAIKFLGPAALGCPRARARFEREVELTARLQHPHIARLYDSGVLGGDYYYVMELIDGLPLDRYAELHRLGRRQLLELFVVVCRAVRHAHQRGVIHRDIKPANILIDERGEPHVVDFGLAKSVADGDARTLSLDGEVGGTLPFLAPEQAAGEQGTVDTRCDVYSLGVVLYQLLTGCNPHDVSGPHLAALRRIALEEVRAPRDAAPGLDRELETLLLKALAKEPARRYGSAGELAADLERYLAGEPLVAKPPTLAYLLRMSLLRHRVAVALTACVAGVLAFAAVADVARVGRERNRAVASRVAAEEQGRVADEQWRVAQAYARRAEEQGRVAEEQRRVADLRLAESLVAQGDSMAEAGRWVKAKRLYNEARDRFAAQGEPTLAAELGLLDAYEHAPPPLNVYEGHGGRVCAAAFCPGGDTAVSAGMDRTLILWDLKTGRKMRTFHGHGGKVLSLAVSGDGRWLLSGSEDHTARLWDLRGGSEVRRFVHLGPVLAVAFSPSGETCATASREVKISRVETGDEVCQFGGHHGYPVFSLAFSPDGRRCVSGGGDKSVRAWDSATGRPLREFPNDAAVLSVCVSPDGRRTLSAGLAAPDRAGAVIKVWDSETGTLVRELSGHASDVYRLSFKSGGGRVLSAGGDGTVKVWDLDAAREVGSFSGDGAELEQVVFSGDGRLALSGGAGDLLRLWDVAGDVEVFSLRGHGSRVNQVVVRGEGEGRILLSASDDHTLRLWDVATRREMMTIGPVTPFLDAAVSGDGRSALSVCAGSREHENVVKFWDLATCNRAGNCDGYDLCTYTDVAAVAFGPDGRLGLTASGTLVKAWDLGAKREVASFRSAATLLRSISPSPDGLMALSSTTHGAAAVWDLETGLQFQGLWGLTEAGHVNGNVAFSADLRRALAGSGNDLLVWNPVTGRPLARLVGHRGEVRRVALPTGGGWAVSGGSDGAVKVWDLGHLREAHTFSGLPDKDRFGGVNCVALSPDDRLLACGTDDGMLRVWDLARPAAHRRFETRLGAARGIVGHDPEDVNALATLGEWYALRGQWAWGWDLLSRAKAGGASVSALTLGRCYWAGGRADLAAEQFHTAGSQGEVPPVYVLWCSSAARREAGAIAPPVRVHAPTPAVATPLGASAPAGR